MSRYLNKQKHINILKASLLLLFIVLSFIVSIREPILHADSIRYAEYFENVKAWGIYGDTEILFLIITYVVSIFSSSLVFYFFFLFWLLILFHYVLIRVISKEVPTAYKDKLNLYFIFLLSSTWFYVCAVNGIRQGLSLPLIYLSLVFLHNNRLFMSSMLLLISAGFHYSAFLYLPFFLIIKFNFKFCISLYFIFLIGYYLEINEAFIKYTSSLLNLPLYGLIKEFAHGTTEYWYGFQAKFVFYTTFFLLFFIALINYIHEDFRRLYVCFLKIFIALSCCYFFYGFGAFSNRYAFGVWNFIPLMLTLSFISVSISAKDKMIILVIFIPVSVLIFISRFYWF